MPSTLPTPIQTSCCCPCPRAGTGPPSVSQPWEGSQCHQAPGPIQQRPAAARGCSALSNTSYSRSPMALSEESDYPAERYRTHPKQNLFTFVCLF